MEYILLLAVVVTFMSTLWNSQAFRDFFGPDSNFFKGIAEKVRVNYHFAATVATDTALVDSPIANHPSYVLNGETRFFTIDSSEFYPNE